MSITLRKVVKEKVRYPGGAMGTYHVTAKRRKDISNTQWSQYQHKLGIPGDEPQEDKDKMAGEREQPPTIQQTRSKVLTRVD